jgi:hypothetical protein
LIIYLFFFSLLDHLILSCGGYAVNGLKGKEERSSDSNCATHFKRGYLSHDAVEDNNALLPVATLSFIFREPTYLKEKEQTAQVVQRLIQASQQVDNEARYIHYYTEADQYWIQERQAWEERTIAQRNVDLKTATLLQMQKLLAIALEERSKLDTQKTLLARISQTAGKAAAPLSFIPGPVPFGGIAHTVSGITDKLNQLWVEKDVMLAQRAVTQVTEVLELAIKLAGATNEKAATLRKKAQEREHHSRLLEFSARKDDLERLHPPVTSFDEADWHDWATRLVQTGKGDSSSIEYLVNHGMSDPLWAAEVVTATFSEGAERRFQIEKKRKRIEPLEKNFQMASQMHQEAREKAICVATSAATARQRLETARQIYQHWKTELEESNAALNELEKPENARTPEIAIEITKQKENFSAALTKLEQSFSEFQLYEEAFHEAGAALALEENKTIFLRNEATAAEEALLRNRERAELDLSMSKDRKPLQITLRLPKRNEENVLTTQNLEESEKKKGNIDSPEVLNKAYETIGKALFKEEGREQFQEQQEAEPPKGLPPETREPSPDDLARWEASRRAEDFIEERNEVIANIKRRKNAASHAPRQIKEEAETSTLVTNFNNLNNLNDLPEEEGSEENDASDVLIKAPLSRKYQRQGESSRVSSITTKVKSEKSQSSIGSYVSKSSIHSWTGSVGGDFPAGVASSATKLELKGLKKATHAINEMANQWAELVSKADAERVAAGGAPYPDEETLFEAWQEADAIAEAAWKKRCNIQEETLRIAAMATTWEANTARWEARAAADRLLRDQEEAEIDLVKLVEQQKPLEPAWLNQYQNTSENLRNMERTAAEAQKKWNRLAELEPTIQVLSSKEKKNSALKKLRDRDQTVNTHWQQVREDYYAEKDYKPRRAEKARLAQEIGAYKFDLLTEKNKTIANCFSEADAISTEFKKWSDIDLLEQSAMAKYEEDTLAAALKAAWEKISGAEEAWEFRVSKAEKESRVAQRKLETSTTSEQRNYFATGERLATRLRTIAEVDKKAFDIFQQEAKEFADIEATWRAQLKVEEETALLQRIAAAKNHLEGDVTLWNSLSHQERKAYNEAVITANEEAVDLAHQKFKDILEATLKLDQQARKKVWFSKQTAKERAEKASIEMTKLSTEVNKKKLAMRRAKLLEFDYNAKNLFISSLNTQTLNSSYCDVVSTAWNEAQAFCHDLDMAWAQKAKVVQMGYQQATRYARNVQAILSKLAEGIRTKLDQLSIEHQDFMTAATLDLIKLEEEKETWSEKETLAAKHAEKSFDPQVLRVKAVFEKVRMMWEGLRYSVSIKSVESIFYMADLIKTSVSIADKADWDPPVITALKAMSTITDALKQLASAARSDSRIHGAAIGGSAAMCLLLIPMGFGIIISRSIFQDLKESINATPLAPCTRKTIHNLLDDLQKDTEAAAQQSRDTLWAADTAWCCVALRDALAFVNALTHAATVDEL